MYVVYLIIIMQLIINIGLLLIQRADFAIADLTVTESRQRYIDFTEPFMENQLSAIIRKEDAVGLKTLEDLVQQNEAYETQRTNIAYGTYRTGSTFFYLSRSRDPVARQMYTWMSRHPEALVTSAKEGFDRVNAGRYAFIVESTFAEYLTGLYCNLTILYDTRQLYPRQFAIALPKGSPYLKLFNEAIRELKANGVIDRLKAKYWTNRCFNPAGTNYEEQDNNNNNNKPLEISKVTPPSLPLSPPRPIKMPIDDEHRRSMSTGNVMTSVPKRYHETPLEARSQMPSIVSRPADPIQSEWQPPTSSRVHPHPRMPAYHPHNPNGYHYNRRKYPQPQSQQPNSIESGLYSSASNLSLSLSLVALMSILLVRL